MRSFVRSFIHASLVAFFLGNCDVKLFQISIGVSICVSACQRITGEYRAIIYQWYQCGTYTSWYLLNGFHNQLTW